MSDYIIDQIKTSTGKRIRKVSNNAGIQYKKETENGWTYTNQQTFNGAHADPELEYEVEEGRSNPERPTEVPIYRPDNDKIEYVQVPRKSASQISTAAARSGASGTVPVNGEMVPVEHIKEGYRRAQRGTGGSVVRYI